MNVSKITTPFYCWDAKTQSTFLCWILGYQYDRVKQFQPMPHSIAGAGRGMEMPVQVAARQESETCCCVVVGGYAEGTNECMLCDTTDDMSVCGCLTGMLYCLLSFILSPLWCILALL